MTIEQLKQRMLEEYVALTWDSRDLCPVNGGVLQALTPAIADGLIQIVAGDELEWDEDQTLDGFVDELWEHGGPRLITPKVAQKWHATLTEALNK